MPPPPFTYSQFSRGYGYVECVCVCVFLHFKIFFLMEEIIRMVAHCAHDGIGFNFIMAEAEVNVRENVRNKKKNNPQSCDGWMARARRKHTYKLMEKNYCVLNNR